MSHGVSFALNPAGIGENGICRMFFSSQSTISPPSSGRKTFLSLDSSSSDSLSFVIV